VAPQPTGSMHEVPLDDLLFSTTDAKGVIDEANEVFTRNARYSRDELIGAPHNIIRHPDMPGGVFAIMWDLLAERTPVCAYVLNLAGDGSAYWAFATIVPLGERYLSVRSTPCNIEARDLLHSLYADVRAKELQARAGGASASDVAELGRDLLVAALGENGFGSYADLQLDLVPVELAARDAAGPTPASLAEGGKALRRMVRHATRAQTILIGFSEDLAASLSQADALARDLRRCAGSVETLAKALLSASDAAAADGSATTPPQVGPERLESLRAEVADLGDQLATVVRARKQLRLSAAIARLQAEAVGRYVVAVADRREDPRVSERALASLSEALLAILDTDVTADRAAGGAFEDQVGATTATLEAAQDAVAHWRAGVGHATPGTAGAHDALRTLDVALEAATGMVARVREHGASLGAATTGLDRDGLAAELHEIVDLAAKV